MADAHNAEVIGDRIERLLDELDSVADPDSRARVEELVRLVAEWHGAALARIVEILEGSGSAEVMRLLAADELVASLLIVHDLHPDALTHRVEEALAEVRPYLASHGGDVELLSIDGDAGVALIRLIGSCDGCPSSSVTLELAVEKAIRAAAPEIGQIDVEGRAPKVEEPAGPGPISVQLGRKPAASSAGDVWERVDSADALTRGEAVVVTVGGEGVFVCRTDLSHYAYADGCPVCASTLAGASIDGEVLRCSGCSAAYHLRLAGRSLDGLDDHLSPRPLLLDGGHVKVAPASMAGAR